MSRIKGGKLYLTNVQMNIIFEALPLTMYSHLVESQLNDIKKEVEKLAKGVNLTYDDCLREINLIKDKILKGR